MTQPTIPSFESEPRRPMLAKALSSLIVLGLAMACSGNTYLGGGQSEAGSAGKSGAAATSQGRSGNTATSTSGSTVGGAVAAKGGAVGSTADCTSIQCFRNVQCVTSCSGPVVQDGCCPCPSGSFDSIQCSAEGGASGLGGAMGAGGAPGSGGAVVKTGGAAGKAGATATGGVISSGGSSAKGGATLTAGVPGRGGATSTGGASTKGGATGTGGECNASNDIFCFRAVDCVEKCGGPILQSGCCPCPTGTFDSIQCSGAGGSSSTGGAPSTGGTSSTAGGVECKSAADCQIIGDCCGCYAFGPGQSSSCPMECLTSLTCDGFDPQPKPQCITGHCVMNRSCDDSRVTCKRATPQCATGKMPSLTEDGTCWDGNCIDIADCSAVTSCDVCKSNGLMCVYENGVRGVAHCVPKPYDCMAISSCGCFSELCGAMTPCGDIATGISCGGG